MLPIQRVNVEFSSPMLSELDDAAKELNISRQAVIKFSNPAQYIAIPITYSRLSRSKSTQCDLNRQLRDTITDTNCYAFSCAPRSALS